MRLRFFLNELLHFLFREKIIAAINGFVADSDLGHITQRFISALYEHVISIQQIAVDILDDLGAVTGVQNFFRRVGRGAESDDDAVNVGLDLSLAVPAEGPMGKIDMNAGFKQRFPEIRYAFPL